MKPRAKSNTTEFEQVLRLIEEARSRAFSKVNAELVFLYYNVGKTVSEKVSAGNWGESTVDELAKFISSKLPTLSGFNRRGLYRMKQFFESYSVDQFVEPLAAVLQSAFKSKPANKKVSAVPTQIKKSKSLPKKVSAVPTQKHLALLHEQFVTTLLTQITWANHLEILSATKTPEEKFFYLVHCIKEKWSMRELRRQ